MFKLAAILFPVIATTLMGIAVVAVLSLNMQSTWGPILWASLGALLVAAPVSWLVARSVPGVRES